MTSRPFPIGRAYIEFYIAGAKDLEKAAVRLLIDGKALRSATGNEGQTLERVRWEVRDLKGRVAALEVVDFLTEERGNIKLDHVVFRDRVEDTLLRRPIHRVASEQALDAERLGRWAGASRWGGESTRGWGADASQARSIGC